MPTLRLLQPGRILIGAGCAREAAGALAAEPARRALMVTSPQTAGMAREFAAAAQGVETLVYEGIDREPTIPMFGQALEAARAFGPDTVIGLGGGSALDVAKLVAALACGAQKLGEVFGTGLLKQRAARLWCLPTTAGTGSEVSPNSILLDEGERLKKAVISPCLVPDAAVIDPLLAVSMPPAVTAASGLDALTHSVEAFANRCAHPAVDVYALEGIRLVGRHLLRAVRNGGDLEAREGMALASLYGGLCLGPVNTAAVHALAYPLGGEFQVAHGVSNAVLLPHVLEYNLPAAPERYARVAEALGAEPTGSDEERARRGIQLVRELIRECGVPGSLKELGVAGSAIPRMVESGMRVTRLLKNNLREVTPAAAAAIYRAALG